MPGFECTEDACQLCRPKRPVLYDQQHERCENRLLADIQIAKYQREAFVIVLGFFNAAEIDLPHRADNL